MEFDPKSVPRLLGAYDHPSPMMPPCGVTHPYRDPNSAVLMLFLAIHSEFATNYQLYSETSNRHMGTLKASDYVCSTFSNPRTAHVSS